MKQREPPQPPQPPPFRRKVKAGWLQIVGVTALSLLPIAALTGAFGIVEREARVSAGDLELRVQYPQRMRYQTSGALELQLENKGSQPLQHVTVHLPADYLSGFAGLQFTPQLQRLSERGAEVELGDVPPGQTRRIMVELTADDYGRHGGQISASAAGAAPAQLEVGTLVLP